MNEAILLADFIMELDAAEDTEGCFKALTKVVEALGFGGVVYTAIPTGTDSPLDIPPLFLRSAGFDPKFLAHYEEAGFAEHDFTIKRILNGDLKVMDWWQEEQMQRLAAPEKNVIATAREDYRIRNGLSIPTLSTAGQIAGASVISEEQGREFELLVHERLRLLGAAIRTFHNHIYANPRLQKPFLAHLLDRLSERDREMLRFTARGKPLKAYQDRHNTSPSAAANQRSRLFKKVGVRNASELMYIAGVLRLLELI